VTAADDDQLGARAGYRNIQSLRLKEKLGELGGKCRAGGGE